MENFSQEIQEYEQLAYNIYVGENLGFFKITSNIPKLPREFSM